MGTVQALPGTFPLHEDRDLLSEREFVIFKLLCRPVASLAEADSVELSSATGDQVSPERCDQLIRALRIDALPGLGSWIARLMAEAGLGDAQVRTLAASEVVAQVNGKVGYPICNDATTHALARLQREWRGVVTLQD
ncbi:MAG: hypothetical protein Q9M26_02640 [Mariprofundales bacterium]|nr:hypothetical protein [Mariprofundales bacterium]